MSKLLSKAQNKLINTLKPTTQLASKTTAKPSVQLPSKEKAKPTTQQASATQTKFSTVNKQNSTATTTSIASTASHRLGILGGGQLAQMLALAAHPLQVQPHILSENPMDPAAQVTKWHYLSSLNSQLSTSDIQKNRDDFFRNIDSLTFESEFVDVKPLRSLLKKYPHLHVFPSLDIMETLQFRHLQKQFLLDHKIPTAEFLKIETPDDLQKAFKKFKGRFVLKKSFGGYDGYGTFYIRSPQELQSWIQNLSHLKKTSQQKQNAKTSPAETYIAEAFVPFQKELAIIFLRSQDGSLCQLPLVQSHQQDSRCDWVKGPIVHSKAHHLSQKIRKALQRIKYVGCIAFELFDTGSELLVNEVAPRVHNTGHYSQLALSHSQFQLHVLAGLGHTLPTTPQVFGDFVMTNLIGQDLHSDSSSESSKSSAEKKAAATQQRMQSELNNIKRITKNPTSQSSGLFARQTTGQFHWYGKTETRPGRKMGHINYVGENQDQLLKTALRERQKIFKQG